MSRERSFSGRDISISISEKDKGLDMNFALKTKINKIFQTV